MLKGVFTAIITPFTKENKIDEKALRKLIDEQIAAGVSGIVPCGTTGESPTLTYEEHDLVIEIVCDQVKGKCEIIAGTGSNSTDEAIMMTEHAKKAGATATLQVVPYYNKPTQKGLYQHFKTIAEAVDIPNVIYNIASRTGINLETSTLKELSKIKNIVGVKEASGSLPQIMSVINSTPDDFSVLSGDDNLVLPLMAAGGHGVISVASNVIPKKMVEFVNLGFNNDFSRMRKVHYELSEFFSGLFLETNPIPVKKILALKGKIESVYRLPLCEPEQKTIDSLNQLITKYNI
ncbi:MAG: 4-hydroxy-tetrahydrodipicolinate synthase [Spirochaetes bacterium]|nr:4-hydroxy-tetrahydrodipicolinate synthase [Spirochaetota bacterium]